MIHWSELTSPELGDRIDAHSVAIMVLGAVEQHGCAMPRWTVLAAI